MRFTIAIPARNGEQFLRQALESALDQVRPADEVLLVDDASTDRTAEIARCGPFAERVRYVRNERPTGFADAWNRAARLAAGEFVAILHQDDLLHPEYLLRVGRALERYPAVGHVFAACVTIDGEGRVIARPPGSPAERPVLHTGKEYARRYLRGVLTNRHIHRCPGVTTRREILVGTCPYRAEAGQIADDDFFLRVGACTDVAGIALPLASFREHGDSITARLDSLSFALARDYTFQVRWYKEHNALLESADLEAIRGQAMRFVNRLLVEGLARDREDLVQGARGYRDELEALCPGLVARSLPVWARPAWAGAFGGRGARSAARRYVRSVAELAHARDAITRKRGDDR